MRSPLRPAAASRSPPLQARRRLPPCPVSGPTSPSIEVRSASGRRLGLLRKLDAFPLYEFRYEADYDLGTMLGAGTSPETRGSEASAAVRPGMACSCFAASDLDGHRVMGRNFDWDRDPVLVLLTSPAHGHASMALVDIRYLGYSAASPPEDNPARLEDAPALPFDGANDAGLAVGMMAVPHAEGMGDEARPVVDDLGFIRLLLDRAGNVGEAMALAASCNVRFSSVPLHYFVADRSGASVVIEFSGGRAVFFRGKEGWQVSTNFLFSDVAEERRASECRRYARATEVLAASRGRVDPLALLSGLSQPSTLWSSVYDLRDGTLELALGRSWQRTWTWRPGH